MSGIWTPVMSQNSVRFAVFNAIIAAFFTDPWYDPRYKPHLENQQGEEIFSTTQGRLRQILKLSSGNSSVIAIKILNQFLKLSG